MVTEFEIDLYKLYITEFISKHPPKGNLVTIPVKNSSMICGIIDDLEWGEMLWEEGIEIDLMLLHYNGRRSAYGDLTNLEYRICPLGDSEGKRDIPPPSYLAEPFFSVRFPGRDIILPHAWQQVVTSLVSTDISDEEFKCVRASYKRRNSRQNEISATTTRFICGGSKIIV